MAEIDILQGIDTVGAFRKFSKAATEEAHIVPYQTGLSLDMQRDSNSTETKDGAQTVDGALQTDFEVDFQNHASVIADEMYDSLIDGDLMEGWIIFRKRKNATGQVFAWYLRATVSEDSNDNDADDASTRQVSFSVKGTPKRGWVTLPASVEEALDYVFRGLGVVSAEDATGAGIAYDKAKDAGTSAGEPGTPSV